MTLALPTTTARATCPACEKPLRIPLKVTPEGRNVLVVSADPEEIRAYFESHCAEAPEKHGLTRPVAEHVEECEVEG